MAAATDPFHPYAAQFANPQGPDDARPTALAVVRDVGVLSVRGSNPWSGRVCLVTGATSGIGVETARALHATGADVYIVARNLEKASGVVADILATNSAAEVGAKGKLEVIEMDMDSLASVKKAAAEFLQRSGGKLNVLVNNAAIMACPYTITVDGFERQYAVNHLAHFTLIVLLLPALRTTSAATPGFNSRVVQVSSSAHMHSSVRLDDVNFKTPDHPYDSWAAYGQSKTAMQWTANYVDRVYGKEAGAGAGPVHANSLHPGGIWTGLQSYVPEEMLKGWQSDPHIEKIRKTPAQGAATTVWAAVAPVWEGTGGAYLTDCSHADLMKELPPPGQDTTRYAAHAFDKEGEDKLWKLSLEMVGVPEP